MKFSTRAVSITPFVITAAMIFMATACGGEGRPGAQPARDSPTFTEVPAITRAPIATGAPIITEIPAITRAPIATGDATPEPAPVETGPAEYTKSVVAEAIERYEEQGLEATVTHHNNPDNVDGQWYVFILDGDGEIVSHFSEHLIGENLSGSQGTDAGGYNFGPDMLAADEEGRWISYIYNNPANIDLSEDHRLGVPELKHAWVVRHDGLLFGSGWYINGDDFAERLVAAAVDAYKRASLAGITRFLADPGDAALSQSAAYYSTNESIEGEWFAIVVDEEQRIIASFDAALVGQNAAGVYGDAVLAATEAGSWVVSSEPGHLHAWMQVYDGMLFGSGWYKGKEER